jgi:hypothetical protein
MVVRFLLLSMATLSISWLGMLLLVTQGLRNRVDIDFGIDAIPVVRCTLNYMHLDFNERGHNRRYVTFQPGYEDGYTSILRWEHEWQLRLSIRLSWLMPFLGLFAAGAIWEYCRRSRSR